MDSKSPIAANYLDALKLECANYFEGDMLELLIFDQDLTGDELPTVNECLRRKYNLWQ